ncbi:hypothetical protein [Streptomyces sp. SAS_272]|uniref:hypothetical protein n=1 Tax=Streptomyces sp. SAS_272 TaxID=3412747 RepID=UPI00403D0356
MTAEWYVLIEEDREFDRLRPDGMEIKLHRFMLVATHHVEGDEAQAAAVAEDAALHYVPGTLARLARPGDQPARHALLTQDGAWVVQLTQRHLKYHIRVTTARLMHSQEEKKAPPKNLKGMLRSALEAPQPAKKPWTPTAARH